MGMGGGGSKPDVVTPGEAAQAAVGTAGAGEMMSVANQPIEQYANLLTTTELGPAETQAQQSLANQAALQSAQAQMDIQSRVDPQAYAQRQMRMRSANQRLSGLYAMDPGSVTYRAPQAYAMPATSSLPALSDIRANANVLASNLATGAVDATGANPMLNLPAGAQAISPSAQASVPYPAKGGSYYV